MSRPGTRPTRLGTVRRLLGELVEHRAMILAALALFAIAAGGLLELAGTGAGAEVWRVAVILLSIELSLEVGRTIIVERHLGVDTIALVAMVGSLALGEELAGAIVGLMFSGGAALEDVASTRARRELTLLVERAPRVAQRLRAGIVEEVPVGEVQTGDIVLVRTGEVVPVDGSLVSGEAVLDTSTLSGEPLPVTLTRGAAVLSGTANAGPPFDVRAERPAAESAYAALVRLVEQAEAHRAPFVRMADRYAGFFLPATLVVAGGAWALTNDPVRALAVVVVATPCPLILAAPIAFVCGLSRAARAGVIVKGAGAVETLGNARTVLFDKTGTLTVGTPEVRETLTRNGVDPRHLMRLAASLDQMSAHVLGRALVRSATASATGAGHALRHPRGPRPGHRGHRGRTPGGRGKPRLPARAGCARGRGRRGLLDDRERLGRGACTRCPRRPPGRRHRDGRRAAPRREGDRRASPRRGCPPRGDGVGRPAFGRREDRRGTRRRPRLCGAVAGAEARGGPAAALRSGTRAP